MREPLCLEVLVHPSPSKCTIRMLVHAAFKQYVCLWSSIDHVFSGYWSLQLTWLISFNDISSHEPWLHGSFQSNSKNMNILCKLQTWISETKHNEVYLKKIKNSKMLQLHEDNDFLFNINQLKYYFSSTYSFFQFWWVFKFASFL